MNILVSNDDGCTAPGLRVLATTLAEQHSVQIVAPDRNRSGASNSLTILHPLRPHRHDHGDIPGWCVDGTPTDCVHLALTGLLDVAPDMVVSGINAGANLGDDTIYSGTVAAAMEGRRLATAAIAVSCVEHNARHYPTAARVTVELIARLQRVPLPRDTILNVNVPDLPYEEIKGIQVTRLGHRRTADSAVKSADPRGRPIWWVGAAGPEEDAGPGTDFHAVNHGYVSVTPLLVDLTKHSALDSLRAWIES